MEQLNKPVRRLGIGYKVSKALPIAVVLMSTLALFQRAGDAHPTCTNYPSLIVSVLGIVGGALCFFRSRNQQSIESAHIIFLMWAVAQLPVVRLAIFTGSYFSVEEPAWPSRLAIWSTSQFLDFPLPMVFTLESGSLLYVAFNLIPLLFLAWIRRWYVAENFGQ